MCDAPSAPDTSAQQAEAARQRDEQDQRQQDLLAQQQAEFERERQEDLDRANQQRAEDQARQDKQLADAQAQYQQQLADARQQAQQQNDAAMALERDRQAQEAAAEVERQKERQDDIARAQTAQDKADAAQAVRDQQQRDRDASDQAFQKAQADWQQQQAAAQLKQQQDAQAAAEAAANAQAEQARTYATGRQAVLDSSINQINTAYGKFDDNYFNDYAKTYADAYIPKIRQAADDANRAATFGFARAGNLDSSAADYRFGRLAEDEQDSEAQAAQEGVNAAKNLRAQIDAQRSNAINTVQQGVATAPVQLPNGIDAADQVSSLSSTIGALTSHLASDATSFAPAANSGNTDFSSNFDIGPVASLYGSTSTGKSKYGVTTSSSPFSGASTALVA